MSQEVFVEASVQGEAAAIDHHAEDDKSRDEEAKDRHISWSDPPSAHSKTRPSSSGSHHPSAFCLA